MPTVFWQSLFIWDIVALAFILPIVKVFTRDRKGQEDRPIQVDGFIEDLPITKISSDSFNRNVLAKEVGDIISRTQSEKSFAIGVLGGYGSGKTSFLNLIEANLEDKAISLIKFQPWATGGVESIQNAFFDTLIEHLAYENPKLSTSIYHYSRKLKHADTKIQEYVGRFTFFGRLLKKSIDEYGQVKNYIEKSQKKIVVIIDDVDRLYKDEIIEILRIIRNSGNFPNVFYLIAYEKNYVQESLKYLNPNIATDYTDKIIQLEVPLPKREDHHLRDYLTQHLEPILSNDDFFMYQENIAKFGLNKNFEGNYSFVFRHSRDVIKFVNTFVISYRLLGSEVYFMDLFVLELLKFRFPIVYDLLYDESDRLLFLEPQAYEYLENYQLKKSGDENDNVLIIEELRNKGMRKDNLLLVSILLRTLFDEINNVPAHRIANPMFFQRYFRYRLSANDISEVRFEKSFETGKESLFCYIDECLKDKLSREILNRLYQHKPTAQKEYELLIEAIFYLGSKYVNWERRRRFNNGNLLWLISTSEGSLAQQLYMDDLARHKTFLNKLFYNTSLPYLFANELIFEIKRQNIDIGFSIAELVDYQVIYFNEYVTHAGLDESAMWLFWGVREFATEGLKPITRTFIDGWRFEPAIIPFIKRAVIKNNPLAFLKASIEVNLYDKTMFKLEPHIVDIYDRFNEIRYIVSNHDKLNNDVKREYLDFLNKCNQVPINQFIKYEFTTDLKKESND